MTELHLHGALRDLDAAQWDALRGDDNPFLSHAFLSLLEDSGCLRRDLGWEAQHLALYEGGQLVGVAPCYLKTNSHGEFVFDHVWAHAYGQHGVAYFPKYLCGVPYSPVTGPRLLAHSPAHRRHLADALTDVAAHQALSSVHVNFHLPAESNAFPETWCGREDLQYIWRNRHNWQTFDDFLAAMDHKHRKNIRHERRRLADAGVRMRWVAGGEASAEDCRRMHDFYLSTFELYGNHPALTGAFFQRIVETLPDSVAMCFALLGDEVIAGAFFLQSSTTLYGRYWGASRELPGLHFETCYYQGIEHCLRTGRHAFEPGAGGVHKIARGFLPERTFSHHWIRDPEFRQAIAAWCAEEARGMPGYLASLSARSPFK